MRTGSRIAVFSLVALVAGSLGAGTGTADPAPSRAEREALANAALGQGEGAASGAAAAARADFNGDGKTDLAVGALSEDVGAAGDAGAVSVLYGGAVGLKKAGNQFWTQEDLTVGDGSQNDDNFGASLASGDFNRDGFADLAIGIPGQEVNAVTGAGAVAVLYGSPTGLTAAGNQLFTEASFSASDGEEANDHFGTSLAAGNLGRTRHADLAVGVPEEDLSATQDAGAFAVLFGSASGLSGTAARFIDQADLFVEGTPAKSGLFGRALVAANFGRSALADLAVSAPGAPVGAAERAGAVQVFYGAPDGFIETGDQYWTQDSEGIRDAAEDTELFGFSLAAANLGKSLEADLAVGAPFHDVGGALLAGSVTVIYGSPGGLTATGNQQWTQDSRGILDKAEPSDALGISVAAADFGKTPQADLAIGAPLESISGHTGAGAVNVIYGSSGGLTASGNQFWTQDSTGILDAAQEEDAFGLSLSTGNYGRSSQADLAIGVPEEDLPGPIEDAGAVNVIYGTPAGLAPTGNQFWNQNSDGILDTAEADDHWGRSLGAGSTVVVISS